jgi:hypothetical protein
MVVPANAGWYTLPVFDVDFPYGLRGTPATEESLRSALGRQVVLQLGEADTDPRHRSLCRNPEADRQGTHRFVRGWHFFDLARREAERRGVPFA